MNTPLTPPCTGPEVFIAIPYEDKFKNIYYAIQNAVVRAGACPIRLDKKKEPGDILAKAHQYLRNVKAVVAVITDRNANVLYEVGYARALDKSVLPVIQVCPPNIPPEEGWRYKSPFNVRPITTVCYEDDLAAFEEELVEFIRAAIGPKEPPLIVSIAGTKIREGDAPLQKWQHVVVRGKMGRSKVTFAAYLQNNTKKDLDPIHRAHLYCGPDCRLVPHSFWGGYVMSHVSDPVQCGDEALYDLSSRYRINVFIQSLPPGEQEDFRVTIRCRSDKPEIVEPFLLKIRVGGEVFYFPYVLNVVRR